MHSNKTEEPTTENDRNARFYRMTQIREAIDLKPRSFGELIALVKGKKAARTLQYDLEGMSILGMITLSEKDGLYYSTEKKQTYRTPAEYNTALKHSRNLLFSNKNDKYDEKPDRKWCGSTLWEPLTESLANGEFPNLIDHLRTGYPEVYEKIQRYSELKEKYPNVEKRINTHNYPPIPSALSTKPYKKDDFDELDFKDNEVQLVDPDKVIPGTESGIYEQDVKEKAVVFKVVLENLEISKEFNTLKHDIASDVLRIMDRVANGTPLEGYCDSCPTRYIKIG